MRVVRGYRDENEVLSFAPAVRPIRMTAGDSPRPQSAAMVYAVLLLALSALVLAPGLLSGPSLDAAVFMQVAERMRDGATLYSGIWDHKPPGIYLSWWPARACCLSSRLGR